MSIKTGLTARISCLLALSAVLALATTTQAAVGYEDQLRMQLSKIAPTAEQNEPFRAVLANSYGGRNSALERAQKKTHMNQVPCEPKKKCDRILTRRITRELKIEADLSVTAMAAVLTKDQLAHYEKFVRIANDQFMARVGLQ